MNLKINFSFNFNNYKYKNLTPKKKNRMNSKKKTLYYI